MTRLECGRRRQVRALVDDLISHKKSWPRGERVDQTLQTFTLVDLAPAMLEALRDGRLTKSHGRTLC